MKLELTEFTLFQKMIYEKTGIMFEERKLAFLQPRILQRINSIGCETVREYYRYLRYNDPNAVEFQNLINTFTTNETYFFREYSQLTNFANDALPLITDAKRAANDYTLNIWSAACSTGDEPYTLAIILKECLDDFSKWRIRIFATDIDTNVLSTAKAGVYSERSVRDIPAPYLKTYFSQDKENYYLSTQIKSMVTFAYMNFREADKMRQNNGFDFIFCRNVLIYFDDDSRKQVLNHFYDALVPGGFIFLGHSESVGRISAAFEVTYLNGAIVYRKPSKSVKSKPSSQLETSHE